MSFNVLAAGRSARRNFDSEHGRAGRRGSYGSDPGDLANNGLTGDWENCRPKI